VVKALMVWINRLGYKKVILQHDPEEALRALVEHSHGDATTCTQCAGC